ncbi:hypothetical protein ACTHQN_06035 [Curtobacterium flaccumfaciens]|uniref:hypothetical protein n=1 Tax=Curtobacterium flaccumfaciens TaxID=2035 RepID=UPI003F7E4D8D
MINIVARHERAPRSEVREHRHGAPTGDHLHVATTAELDELDADARRNHEAGEPTGGQRKAGLTNDAKLPWSIRHHGH